MIACTVMFAICLALLITVFVLQLKLLRLGGETVDRLVSVALNISGLKDGLTDEKREDMDEATQKAQRTFEEALNGIMQYTMNDAYRKPGGGADT